MEALFGFLLLCLVAAVGWCVASEGAWGAAIHFFCVLFAGLLTMSFFELAASPLEKMGRTIAPFADFLAFFGLFGLFTFLLRLATDQLAPTQIELDASVFQIARRVFAVASGYTTMAIVLTGLHTAPLPREFLGFKPEARNLFDAAAPDRQWLGFTQWVSENVLWSGRVFDGPIAKVEGTSQTVWPSFPIRYATKRADYGGARKASTAPPPSAPSSGGPQPVSGGASSGF